MFEKVFRAGILAVLVFTASAAWGEERYTYTGEPFTNPVLPYVTGDRITGWFEIDEPLEPYVDGEDIAGRLLNYRFEDGVGEYGPIGMTVCDLRVWTNGVGAIRFWSISIAESPAPATGNPQLYLLTRNEDVIQTDEVGEKTADASGCPDPGDIPDLDASNFNSPGSWTTTADTTPQPTTYDYQGQLFSHVEVPNASGDAVSGSITLDAPLLPRMDAFDIEAYITAFSFTDGRDVFNGSDGVVCSATVSTDLWGRIDRWDMHIAMDSNPSGGGQRLLYTLKTDVNNGGDLIESGTSFSSSGASPCVLDWNEPMTTSEVEVPGEWFSDAYPTVEQTRYQYRGEPYEFVAGAGELGGRAGAYVEFDGKLPANLELEPLEDIVVEFWFGDSMQSRLPADSELCDFRFSTDADGEISDWEIILRELPKPALGEPQQNFEIRHFGSNKSSIGLTQTETDPCGDLDETDHQRTNFPGTWQPPDPIHGDRFEQQTQ